MSQLAQVSGPAAPQPGIRLPVAGQQLPRRPFDQPAAVWWVGVHGGSGESTLERLLPGSRAADHAWPRASWETSAGGDQDRAQVVLVARSNLRGLQAARNVLAEWAGGALPWIDLLGLAVLADAPRRPPAALRDLIVVTGGGAPRLWRVPWVEAWRISEDPVPGAPKEARQMLGQVQALIGEPARI